MSKIKKLQERIAAAVARARALGVTLVAQGRWGVDYDEETGWTPYGVTEVCICGAIALAENPKDGDGILAAIARKYGITRTQAASLSDGFEAYGPNECSGDGFPAREYKTDKTWYRIGRKWRARADRVEN